MHIAAYKVIAEVTITGLESLYRAMALKSEEIKKIEKLWGDKKLCAEYSANCKDISFDTIDEYYEKIMKVYR